MFAYLRKLAIAGSLALGVSACATTGTGIDPAFIAQVQQLTQQVCSFVPTVSTVASIVAALFGAGPAVGAVTEVAQSICSAVTTKSGRYGLSHGSHKAVFHAPNGTLVPVEGYFVR